MIDVEQKHGEKTGAFLARINNEVVGEMTYHMESSAIMAIEHTEVTSSERGNNVGMQLLDVAAQYAREKGVKIKPVCKFVNVMFRKNEDKYADISVKQ